MLGCWGVCWEYSAPKAAKPRKADILYLSLDGFPVKLFKKGVFQAGKLILCYSLPDFPHHVKIEGQVVPGGQDAVGDLP